MSETDHEGRLAVGILGFTVLFVVGFFVALAPRFVGLLLVTGAVILVVSYFIGWVLDVLGMVQ